MSPNMHAYKPLDILFVVFTLAVPLPYGQTNGFGLNQLGYLPNQRKVSSIHYVIITHKTEE